MSLPLAVPIEQLRIIHYPDPRLRESCRPVEVFDDDLRRLAARMAELMQQEKGVGLAAPQVGVNVRLFVSNPSGEADDLQCYVNPELDDLVGSVEADEGCLSIPNVTVPIRRAQRCVIRAVDLDGQAFERRAEDLEARIWQHENDHLGGVLILDKMSPASKIATRRIIKKLEEDYRG